MSVLFGLWMMKAVTFWRYNDMITTSTGRTTKKTTIISADGNSSHKMLPILIAFDAVKVSFVLNFIKFLKM